MAPGDASSHSKRSTRKWSRNRGQILMGSLGVKRCLSNGIFSCVLILAFHMFLWSWSWGYKHETERWRCRCNLPPSVGEHVASSHTFRWQAFQCWQPSWLAQQFCLDVFSLAYMLLLTRTKLPIPVSQLLSNRLLNDGRCRFHTGCGVVCAHLHNFSGVTKIP